MSETLCGSAVLEGPLHENGSSISRVEANLAIGDRIVVKCQLNRTDLSVTYNPRLYIHNTIDGSIITIRNNNTYDGDGNVRDYVFNISVHANMDKNIITCGVGYLQETGPKECYSLSAALIILQDIIPCETPTDETTTKPTTFSTQKTTFMPTTYYTETPPAIAEEIIAGKVFFPVVSIAILVGIILLVANGIQLWVIIAIMKKRGTATQKADDVSATNPIALDPDTEIGCNVDSKSQGNGLHVELDQHGIESEDDSTMIPNGTATAPGVIN